MSKNQTLAFWCAIIFITGCAQKGPGFVREQWAGNLRELGIYPIYPPREDIRVGDIYVTSNDDTDEEIKKRQGHLPLGNLLMSIDASALAQERYLSRTRFFKTPTRDGKEDAAANSKMTSPSSDSTKPDLDYLRQVAFPFFLSASASGAELGALVPVDALSNGVKAALSGIKGVSVSVSAAESYSIPLIDLMPLFWRAIEGCEQKTDKNVANKSNLLTDAIRWTVPQDEKGGTGGVTITVINEVFYARSFDVTMHSENTFGLQANAGLPSNGFTATSSETPTPPTVSETSADSALESRDAKMASASEAAKNARTKAEKFISARNIPAAPGVTIASTHSETGDVGLRATYDRPIAIGYRGAAFRVKDIASICTTLTPTTPGKYASFGDKESPSCAKDPSMDGCDKDE